MKKVLEQQELQKLQELNQKFNQSIYDLGSIQNQIDLLENEIEKFKEERKNASGDINLIRYQINNFLEELENKYGKGSIDLNNGEII